MHRFIPIFYFGVLIPCLFASSALHAKQYKVEVLIFENTTPQRAFESTRYHATRPQLSDATTWELEPSMLLKEADAIRYSNKYNLVKYLSWGQEALPTSLAAVVDIAEPQLTGWFKIYASHLLFANLELDFNGYRMSEKRRLKLNEKHFFDHPKFGVLLQVSRLLPQAEPASNAQQDSVGGN